MFSCSWSCFPLTALLSVLLPFLSLSNTHFARLSHCKSLSSASPLLGSAPYHLSRQASCYSLMTFSFISCFHSDTLCCCSAFIISFLTSYCAPPFWPSICLLFNVIHFLSSLPLLLIILLYHIRYSLLYDMLFTLRFHCLCDPLASLLLLPYSFVYLI